MTAINPKTGLASAARLDGGPVAVPPSGSSSAASAYPWRKRAAGTSTLTVPTWRRSYARRLAVVDTIALTAVVLAVTAVIGFSTDVAWVAGPDIDYRIAGIVVLLSWLVMLAAMDTRDAHVIGHGVAEYRRVAHTSMLLFAGLVILAYFLRVELSRLFVLTAIPIGLLALLFGRWASRQWLRGRQRKGGFLDRVVVIGERKKIDSIARVINRTEGTGYRIIGAITSRGTDSKIADSVDVLGDYAHAVELIENASANTVIVASADDLDPAALRSLSWQMADRDIAWVVAPAMTDIAGPRIHARPLAGLPLVEVAFPVLEGGPRIAKRTADIIGSVLLIVLSSPIMLAAAIAVKVSSPGPVLFTQERIGRYGTPFRMIKFRSMVTDADDELASLLDLQGSKGTPLFKVINDPRVTKVGRIMRRHSIDELPQLFNVLRGSMSLVGPRPQRPAEVELYDTIAQRRLLLKPGMSGLWQVSGRSSLTWEESLRFDLYYVENWSFIQDLVILFRTFRAVLRPHHTAS